MKARRRQDQEHDTHEKVMERVKRANRRSARLTRLPNIISDIGIHQNHRRVIHVVSLDIDRAGRRALKVEQGCFRHLGVREERSRRAGVGIRCSRLVVLAAPFPEHRVLGDGEGREGEEGDESGEGEEGGGEHSERRF